MSSIEKAKIGDVPQIQKMVNSFAARDEMLPRPLSEIYENIRDYFVVRKGKTMIGCVALHVSWSDLAEVKSLAVGTRYQKAGLGAQLVAACINEAKSTGYPGYLLLDLQTGLLCQTRVC